MMFVITLNHHYSQTEIENDAFYLAYNQFYEARKV